MYDTAGLQNKCLQIIFLILNAKQGCFTVASAKRLISSSRNYGEFFKMKWNGWIPLKCNVMAWPAEQDRLPTRMELTKRGMVLQDDLCPLCADNPETSGHLFTACLFATEVWARIASWCKLAPIFGFEVRDLITLPKHLNMRKQESRTLHGIVLTTLWCIWSARNEMVFQRKFAKVVDVMAKIKASSYFWIKNRSKHKCIDWKDWCNCPFISM
ncbi:reverse transcriptase domain, Reverse transcriptase zinc-binding domain protein [Artemisia annua]|uniref:Reverse transcriptase domain, Reverse transcriptase zinc-binding domain protein n=1 Tax=Artemisia annua TaxID=35608 RepID=A0A2U1K9V5_ARTAN|nr:reverse transcriptase domain, Reverse transcriptase zinc-binding domain protein [Artemisia annua]